MGYPAAIEKTLTRTLPDDTLREAIPCRPHVFTRRDGVLCDVRQAVAYAYPTDVFSVIARLGGRTAIYTRTVCGGSAAGWIDASEGLVRGIVLAAIL